MMCDQNASNGRRRCNVSFPSRKVNTLHTSATVNADDLAVDPFAILGCEEADDAGDIDGQTDTADGRPGGGVLVDLVVVEVDAVGNVLAADGVVHVGLNAAGGDDVDGDLLVAEVDSHAAGEGLNGALGAGVDGVLGDELGLAGDGAHEDHAAANLEVLVRLTGDEELATGVDVEDTVKLLGRDILDVAERDDTRVGHADIELAPDLDGLVEELDGLVDVGDVGLDGHGLAAELLDLLDDLVGCVNGVGVVDNDLGAATCELEGHLGAHTAAGAGDEGDFASELGRVNAQRAGDGIIACRGHCDCVWGSCLTVVVELERLARVVKED